MDQKILLRTTLLALEETIRGVASKSDRPSTAVVRQINSVFTEINKIVPGSHFAMFDSYPNPVEVLPQIKLALELLGQDSPSATQELLPADDKASRREFAQTASASGPNHKLRPQIFIGCSVEGLTEANIIQLLLKRSANTAIWSQGVFGLSRSTLETLVEKAGSFTHAILVLTPDDMLIKRADEAPTARDNVLFELGLFMGKLGRERTFVVTEKSVRLPTDLAGIATVNFERGEGVNIMSNMGPVVTQLQFEMGLL
jgi:predicted nucleotide-binding protein